MLRSGNSVHYIKNKEASQPSCPASQERIHFSELLRCKKLLAFFATMGLILGIPFIHAISLSAASKEIHSLKTGETIYIQSPFSGTEAYPISSASYVATVNQGFLKGNYPGIAEISYVKNASFKKETYLIKGLLPANSYLKVNEKKQFHLFGVQKTSIRSWKSSDPSIAAINSQGLLLAIKAGTVRITCQTQHGNIYTTLLDVVNSTASATEDRQEESTVTQEKEEVSVLLSCEENTILLQPGDSYRPEITVKKISGNGLIPDLSWTSSDVSVATVDALGNIRAYDDGTAIICCQCADASISFSINVISDGQSGNHCQLTLLTGSQGIKRTYDLHKQNAHDYDSYDDYLAWHGCAHCSLATVLGAYNTSYAHILPNEVISGIDKTYSPSSEWTKEHEEHSLRYQMPLSLNGISQLLSKGKVNNEYIPSFQYQEARSDILAHLKTGNPVIIEVRQKNCKSGKSSKRWTNSLHTMVFLGAFSDDRVLLCDSVDRSWYDGGQRYKIVSIDDVMEYMFSSSRSTEKYYYDGQDCDGGYIKIYSDSNS